MTLTTLINSRGFNQDTGRAKKAATVGPLFISDRGNPAHVLISIEDYQRLTNQHRNIIQALSMLGLSDIKVEFPRLRKLTCSTDYS